MARAGLLSATGDAFLWVSGHGAEDGEKGKPSVPMVTRGHRPQLHLVRSPVSASLRVSAQNSSPGDQITPRSPRTAPRGWGRETDSEPEPVSRPLLP